MESSARLRFVAMDAAGFAAWKQRAVPAFAADKIASGDWPQAGALQRSQAGFDALLPMDENTPGQHLGHLVDADGRAIGWAWIHIGPEIEGAVERNAFLYDFGIVAALRGKGLAREALAAVEARAHELGATRLGLHVFGHNHVARHLYERAGFMVTDLNLSKPLR
jgi:RimJ/RimL family protein N-acetyltransferase